jgi:hypothetical protein
MITLRMYGSAKMYVYKILIFRQLALAMLIVKNDTKNLK